MAEVTGWARISGTLLRCAYQCASLAGGNSTRGCSLKGTEEERSTSVSKWDWCGVSGGREEHTEGLVLTEGVDIEEAPRAVERAGTEELEERALVHAEREVAEEGVAPDRVVAQEEVEEPAAGDGEVHQVSTVQVLCYLRPHVRLIPAPTTDFKPRSKIQC